MDSQDHAGEPILSSVIIYNIDLHGRDVADLEERASYVISEAFAGLAKEISGEQRVQVEILWDRGVWRPDGEATLPHRTIWSGNVRVRSIPIQ